MDKPEPEEGDKTAGGDDGANAEGSADEEDLNAFFRCDSVKQ